jgi:hypothetical protein
MENKIQKYLDKVVEFLVRDTRMDYEQKRILTPYSSYSSPPHTLNRFSSFPPSVYFPTSFSKYCRDVYGLTDKEIEYVWKPYTDIIKDKIENGE